MLFFFGLISFVTLTVTAQQRNDGIMRYPLHARTRSRGDLDRRQTTEQMTETVQKNYYATISLGSGQQFDVMIDTGSNDLFLPQAGAGPHNTVQPDAAVVPYPGSPACSESYGASGNQGITGTIYTAPYTLAGANAPPSSAFCLVSSEGKYASPEDGILGLGFCRMSSVADQTGNCPLEALGLGSFGIYLSSDDQNGGGFITANGADSGLYNGDLTFESVEAANGAPPAHWVFSTGNGLYLINGVEGFQGPYAFIDTGNPTININPTAARDIWSKVGASSADGSIDCSQAGIAPDIVFQFSSGAYYTLPSSIWVVQNVNTGQCRCTVQPQQTNPNTNPAVFGAPFVKAYYTWFDATNNQIGFAQSIG